MLSVTNSHSEAFKIKDAASYDNISKQFEAFTQTLSLPFVERMIRLAEPQPAHWILDIGTGTGIVAFNAVQTVPKGKVLGVDLSEGMLATAREKAGRLVSAGCHLMISQYVPPAVIHCRVDIPKALLAQLDFDLARAVGAS